MDGTRGDGGLLGSGLLLFGCLLTYTTSQGSHLVAHLRGHLRTRMHVVVTVDGLRRGLHVVVADLPCGEAGEEIGGKVETLLA